MFNVMFLVKKKKDMTQEEFEKYWIIDHTPLTAKVDGIRAYKCWAVTGYDDAPPPYEGIGLISFDDEAAWRTASASPEFQAALQDAFNFQTTEETLAFYTREHTII